ncbi:FAD-dependent oxidoreductase [Frankia sp. CNm7]|uniref:FAD-dependent oxidoreductase n=1 Tax=Frankia nepalensis TaxID=1836974 RepID=A0A937US02_9ACTN|nr:FAD-dependent oxidoreductase [Frankia nepalensis]MBL7501146.1 FAD-dependent oxidoreductase [Frankia nepalensis]MBL7513752.1 FAD-dependent oxidoreductase [Frankia nepalensis]MBL7521091.1 FAD-dependent oxidoreductase [Frankia nepalensis]MBL7631648.1 FAD-dependent oxidoreductase [Frankia nepalensis]
MERVVIVGAGLAGGRTVVELREQGYTGQITLIGAEPHLPYDRPPLSKAVLTGRTDSTQLPYGLHDLDGVELLLGRHATGLEPGAVHTDAGPVTYDALVIASGSAPIRLPGAPGQRVLRTIDDSLALRQALRPGARLVIVGAGWIGAEVATVAAKLGAEVTVVEGGGHPLAPLGREVGGHAVHWYEEAGVTLRVDAMVDKIGEDGLLLAGGEFVPADEIVVGVGARPDVGWLAGCGLVVERGVVVDEHLLAGWAPDTPGAPGAAPVLAVGDCAAWWSVRYGQRMRVEHWDTAQTAPAAAATTLLGLAAGRPVGDLPVYNPVPYFWSEQFGRMVQFAGLPADDAHLVFRGDPTARKEPDAKKAPGWSAGWFAPDGTLTALVTVARPIDMVAGRRLLAADARPDQAQFADPAVPLKALLEG